MEEELKCAYCNDFYCNPVLLPCFHSLCYACALHLQEKFTTTPQTNLNTPSLNSQKVNKYQSNYLANQQSIDNISSAIVNAAKSASNMIAALNSTSTSPNSSSSISPHSSMSAELAFSQNRALSVTDFGSSIVSDLDKLSVFSENDSGLGGLSTTTLTALINSSSGGNGPHHGSLNQNGTSSCSSSNSSRPSSSYISTGSNSSSSGLSPIDFANRHKKPSPSTSSASLPLPPPPPLPACSLYSTYLQCPKCTRMIYMDDMGVDSLTKNTCLENIVERYTEARKLTLKCQMCPPSNENSNYSTNSNCRAKEKDAAFMCEQCEIYYCEDCKDAFHPMRGPLQKHTLVPPKVGRDLVRNKNRIKESKCAEHPTESANYYCLLCKCSCCNLCVTEDSTHLNHQIQPINGFCKSQKVGIF
jgi:tripartite motif-containing protein 9/67